MAGISWSFSVPESPRHPVLTAIVNGSKTVHTVPNTRDLQEMEVGQMIRFVPYSGKTWARCEVVALETFESIDMYEGDPKTCTALRARLGAVSTSSLLSITFRLITSSYAPVGVRAEGLKLIFFRQRG